MFANLFADLFGDDAPVIHAYTRAQAIADGVLVDISETAKKAGFRYPVACTSAVWSDCIEWTGKDNKRQGTCQDQAGRLWDVVWMASRATRMGGTLLYFDMYRVPRGGRARMPQRVKLKMTVGPGDNAEPVITIMFPDED